MDRQPTVMLVDDDPGMRLTVGRILENQGYRVLVAKGGPEALYLAANDRFDVALVDYKMSGMNGGEVCAALRRVNDGAALYIVTAHVNSETEEAALATGANGILHKPVEVPRLLELVAEKAALEKSASRSGSVS